MLAGDFGSAWASSEAARRRRSAERPTRQHDNTAGHCLASRDLLACACAGETEDAAEAGSAMAAEEDEEHSLQHTNTTQTTEHLRSRSVG